MSQTLYALVAAAIAVGLSFVQQMGRTSGQVSEGSTPRLPPGWVIGTVWVIISALLGAALYRVRNFPLPALALIYLLIFNYSYAFAGASAPIEYIRVALLNTLLVLAIVAQVDRTAAAFILPNLVWVGYVNAAFLQLVD